MWDEKKLVKEFNGGSRDALCQIYERYRKDLYRLGVSLLRDPAAAEDALHDVFVSFAQQSGRYVLKGTLKGYLLTSVANRARDILRRRSSKELVLDESTPLPHTDLSPVQNCVLKEESAIVLDALSKIPFEQRQIVLLHLHYDLTFREIACAQGVSINTIQSRYRYALEKLSSLLKEGNHL